MTQPQNRDLLSEATAYLIDSFQRTILFWDTMRERGNNYLIHNEAGKPSVLSFDYVVIKDGRSLARPVNYSLLEIIAPDREPPNPEKRPIIVIDPRAGHGPGIGGFKSESEIGFALKNGHPVYFVTFLPEPVEGQTITDIQQAEVAFIQLVTERHPNLPEPVVIGNCQAGWALALVGADRPDVTGPMVLVGSPLSYWAGADNKNPMRYRGGLTGGTWMVSLISDLGNGQFDGANLVAGFEDLNPANTFWKKYYQLYTNIDSGRERFLTFERWWNGYFYMTGEEIHFIVKNLFVGNALEAGVLEMENGRTIDLKRIEDPVVILASHGDNITPPQQALNWIAKTYGSVAEIKQNGQVIVYRVHEDIGHLGIFVSGRVARKEHRKIIETIDLTELLSPGLYELILEEKPQKSGLKDYDVRFEKREIKDILAMDDGQTDEAAFQAVAAISDFNETAYQLLMRPLIKAMSDKRSARLMRLFHPLRMSRYMIADGNPIMAPVKMMAPLVKASRQVVSDDNVFTQLESCASDLIAGAFDFFRDVRDATAEMTFRLTYNHPLMQPFFKAEASPKQKVKGQNTAVIKPNDRPPRPSGEMVSGGFANGVIRMMVCIAGADHVFHQAELARYLNVLKAHPRLRWINHQRLAGMIKKQSLLIDTDQNLAIAALPTLLPEKNDRYEALNIVNKIATADDTIGPDEKRMIKRFKTIFS